MAMTKRRLIAIVVALSATTGAVAWRSRAEKKSPAAESRADNEEEVATLRARIARLEGASLWRAASSVQPEKAESAAVERPAALAAESPAQAARQQHIPEGAEYVAQIDEKFRAQTIDPSWSQKAVSDATRAISGDLTQGSRLGTVECRASLCRVESSHDSVQAFATFMDTALFSPSRKLWNGSISTQVVSQAPSDVRAVTFIAREGHDVPAAELVTD